MGELSYDTFKYNLEKLRKMPYAIVFMFVKSDISYSRIKYYLSEVDYFYENDFNYNRSEDPLYIAKRELYISWNGDYFYIEKDPIEY